MINQPVPRGFGDAVLRTKPFMTSSIFIVYAGDDVIYPNHTKNIIELVKHYETHKPKAVFFMITQIILRDTESLLVKRNKGLLKSTMLLKNRRSSHRIGL